MREAAIITAFDTARIRGDAEAGKARRLNEYLAELLTPAEQLERSMAAWSAKMDAQIERQARKREGV